MKFKDNTRDKIRMLVSAKDSNSALLCAKEFIESNSREIKNIVYQPLYEKTFYLKKEVIK